MSKIPDATQAYLPPLQSSDDMPPPCRGHHRSLQTPSSPTRITITRRPAFLAPSQRAAQARAGFQLTVTHHYCHLLLHLPYPTTSLSLEINTLFQLPPTVSSWSPPPSWLRQKMTDKGWPQPSLAYCCRCTYEAQDRARCEHGHTVPIKLERPHRTEQVPYKVSKQCWLDQDGSAQGDAITPLHFSGLACHFCTTLCSSA